MKNAVSPHGTCAWWCAEAWAWGVATANVLSVMATKSQGNDANTETKTIAKYLPIFFYFGCLVVYEDIVVSGSFTCIPIVTSTHTRIHALTYIYILVLLLHFRFLLPWLGVAAGVASFQVCFLLAKQPRASTPPSHCILIPFKQ